MKTIGSIVVVTAVVTAAIHGYVSNAHETHEPKFIGYAKCGDTTIAFSVRDSSSIKDTMLLLQQTKGRDTVLALAPVSAAPLIAGDSTVLSNDTLTQVRVARKK